jgi:hypothetical protein
MKELIVKVLSDKGSRTSNGLSTAVMPAAEFAPWAS